ncbi:MAG TPA: lipoyl(octanoyl) transferase LipB [Methylocystis sp.]|nr:lipoyl(octanoyl) transferase LipB [Methylocystis sp.]
MSASCATFDFTPKAAGPVEWLSAEGLVPYEEALAEMTARVAAIQAGEARERVWLLEHPPVYTAGTSAKEKDLLDARFPVFRTGRGGQFTYHGPGQRIVYLMLDLTRRRRDARAYVCAIEAWLIAALADLGVEAFTREGRVGVWVERPDKAPSLAGEPAEDKIAALGLRLSRWVSSHGLALNVAPDLTHFSGITPCGISAAHLGVTSLATLGAPSDIGAVDAALRRRFEEIFGPTIDA